MGEVILGQPPRFSTPRWQIGFDGILDAQKAAVGMA